MASLQPTAYLELVKVTCEKAGHPETAEQQMKYMRNQFDFYGLKAAAWLDIVKDLTKTHGVFTGEDLKKFVRICYEDDHREVHYIATEMTQKVIKKQPADFIYFLEELLLTNSWWDTVDWISKLVNLHFKQYPDLIKPVTEKWMESENIWLQRTAIIFQRYYKKDTNPEILFDYILRVRDSKEFFIQKGAGWALREYSKINPQSVIEFIDNNQLAPLTKREGLKWMKQKGVV